MSSPHAFVQGIVLGDDGQLKINRNRLNDIKKSHNNLISAFCFANQMIMIKKGTKHHSLSMQSFLTSFQTVYGKKRLIKVYSPYLLTSC